MFTKAQRIFPQIVDQRQSSECGPVCSQRLRLFPKAQRAQSRIQGRPHDEFESRGRISWVEIRRFLRPPATQRRTGYFRAHGGPSYSPKPSDNRYAAKRRRPLKPQPAQPLRAAEWHDDFLF